MNDDREEQEGWFAVDIHPWVFFTSALLIIGSVALAILFQARIGDLFAGLQTGIATGAGWHNRLHLYHILKLCFQI